MSHSIPGIAFCDDRAGGSLLVSTDRHIVSLPLDLESTASHDEAQATINKKKSVWELRSVRRLDFGTPLTMARDQSTRLLFMTLKAPATDKNVIGKPQASAADSIAVVAARHRPNRPERLSLSMAQIYQDHPGAIRGVLPCSPCGRVVSFDETGCMVIWRIFNDKATSLQLSDSPVPIQDDVLKASERPEKIDYTPVDDGDEDDIDNDPDTDGEEDDIDALLMEAQKSRLGLPPGSRFVKGGKKSRREKYSNPYERRARGLIKDFETAAKSDPHVWSVGPATMETDQQTPEGFGPQISVAFKSTRIDQSATRVQNDDVPGKLNDALAAEAMKDSTTPLQYDLVCGAAGAVDPIVLSAPPPISRNEVDAISAVNTSGVTDTSEIIKHNLDSSDDDSGSGSDDSSSGDGEDEEVVALDNDDDDDSSFAASEESIDGLDAWQVVDGDEEEEIELKATKKVKTAEDKDKKGKSLRTATDLVLSRVLARRQSGLAASFPFTEESEATNGYLHTSFHPNVVGMTLSTLPSFCHQSLLLSDGAILCVKTFSQSQDLNVIEDVLLPSPSLPPPDTAPPTSKLRAVATLSIGSVIQCLLSPSRLFVAAVADVSISFESNLVENTIAESKDIFVWFYDTSATGVDKWVSLGAMGVPQLAEKYTAASGSSGIGRSGCVSDGCTIDPRMKSRNSGVAIDWADDDTLIFAASLNSSQKDTVDSLTTSRTEPIPKMKSDSSKNKKKLAGRLSKPLFDILLSSLAVSDMFAGGLLQNKWFSSIRDPKAPLQRRKLPTVSVLKNLGADMTSFRSLPVENKGPIGEETMYAVVICGSLVQVVTFSHNSSIPQQLGVTISSFTRFHEVVPAFVDVSMTLFLLTIYCIIL